MIYDRDSGAPAGIVKLGDSFPILGLPPELKRDYYVMNETVGYRNFLLTGVEDLPPLKMQTVVYRFMRSAVRSIHTDKLIVAGDRDEFIRDRVVERTGEVRYGVEQVKFPDANLALLRLRLQISLGHITYEANPNYKEFFEGTLVFRHFYISNRSEDVSRDTLRYTDNEPLMAVLDNSEEAYESSVGDGKPRFELVGDIKEKVDSKVRGRFLLKELDPERHIQFFKSLINFLKRATED